MRLRRIIRSLAKLFCGILESLLTVNKRRFMRYERARKLSFRKFKRYVGVKRQTFQKMIRIIQHHAPPKQKAGRPPELGVEDQVLLAQKYWREYRTYFHIGEDWGVSESTACRKRT